MADAWPTVSVEPLDAGMRQVDAAIRLLFSNDDPLAIHTLAYAAYGLLKKESKTRGDGTTLAQLDADSKHFPEGEFWRRFSDLANALKHPDRIAMDVPEEFNEALLVTCCMLIRELQPLSSREQVAMWLWYHALFFINFKEAPDAYWEWINENWQGLHAETRTEKVKIGANLYRSLIDSDFEGYTLSSEQVLLPWRVTFQPGGFEE